MQGTQEQDSTAIASLTPEGLSIFRKLRDSAQRRERRLLGNFTPEEVEAPRTLLHRIDAQVPHMNAQA